MNVALDHMAGLSSIKWAFEKIDADEDDHMAQRVLEVVKSIGQRGRTVRLNELRHIIDWCRSTSDADGEGYTQG
ncbi:unnamed protein product [marine sediment metagenome]|uniref:Uncharacterized protein n=1 Tax=marine sediment metagenome TaxID=412755 RepID=X1GIT8_9ZZZZ